MILWSVVLEYTIRRVQVNQKCVKLNGTHQVMVYADDVNILGGSVQTVKKNTEASIFTSKEVDLKVNADKTKCMVMTRDQNVGRGQNIKIVPLNGRNSSDIW